MKTKHLPNEKRKKDNFKEVHKAAPLFMLELFYVSDKKQNIFEF